MPNRLITADEVAEDYTKQIRKIAEEYQELSHCTDKEKEEFGNQFAMWALGGLFESHIPSRSKA